MSNSDALPNQNAMSVSIDGNIDKCALKIRPHHGMCIQFFRGEGYSAEFIRHMDEIVRRLNGGALVDLTKFADCICECCPNNICGECVSEPKVRGFDNRVLELCGLSLGDVVSFDEFHAYVRENIIDCGRMGEICGNCEWAYICHGK